MSHKVLIVDDDPQDRKSIATVLQRDGSFDVDFAETGEEGFHKSTADAPAVILIDVVLNGVDGFDICRRLRDAGHRARIIMITGHLDAVDAEKARKSGADEIIEKKAGFPDLVPTIKSLS